MLEIVITVLYTVVVIVALLLIGLVLIQQSKTGGFGSTFGGVGESVFGAQAVNHLSKLTVILTTVFFILTLLLAAISGQRALDNRQIKAINAELETDTEVGKIAVPETVKPKEDKNSTALKTTIPVTSEVKKKIKEPIAVPSNKQTK